MAVKKSELYSSLWVSCDSLRGGMDSSQYKDYILTLLFVKYVSDKFKGVAYGDIDVPEGGSFDDMLALIGNKNIGEEMDKVIARLAEANNLRGIIDNAHFNVANQIHDHPLGNEQHKHRKNRLNTQLAKKTPESLEYVVIHELVHLVEKKAQ
jgi:type I restriction-modification system DNA methylase subunit